MNKINWFRVFTMLFLVFLPILIVIQFYWVDEFAGYVLGLNIIGVVGAWAFTFVLDLLLFIFGYRIYKQIINKQKVFACFNNTNKNFDDLDVLCSALSSLPFKQNIIKDESGIIVDNKAGKYVIRQIKGKGILSGKLEDSKWKIGNNTFDNPFSKENKNFILKSYGLIYNIYGINICDISQIIFKMERDLLNVKDKKN